MVVAAILFLMTVTKILVQKKYALHRPFYIEVNTLIAFFYL
jgi:hypothetical protein